MAGILTDQVALVTGGSSGFGAAICKAFLIEGAKVFIGDIQLAGADALAKEYPGRVILGHLDVTLREEWDEAVAQIEKHFGRLDILVNNAGTSYRNKPTLEVTEAEFRRTFDVNCLGMFHSVQAVFPKFIKQGHGICLNISSVGAERPRRGLVWYNASKGAVSNATKGLALEYGSAHIRVNSICPLLASTGLFESFTGVTDSPDARQQFIANVPLGRLAEVDDVSKAAVYLCSEAAGFLTGVNLCVDGGRAI